MGVTTDQDPAIATADGNDLRYNLLNVSMFRDRDRDRDRDKDRDRDRYDDRRDRRR